MKAILLAAGGVKNIPSAYLPGKKEKTRDLSLEWILHALKENRVSDIILVGGQNAENVMRRYPGLSVFLNPSWKSTGMVASLFTAKETLNGRCLISYADTVYRPSVIKKLLSESRGDIVLAADTQWKTRYAGRSKKAVAKAEKIRFANHHVTDIRRKIRPEQAGGEFAGLVYLSGKGARKFQAVYETLKESHRGKFHEAPSFEKANVTDFLRDLLRRGEKIQVVRIEGGWAELDAPQDLASFVFGTKSVTLQRLKPVLKHGKILEQVSFTVGEWKKRSRKIIAQIQKTLKARHVIARSSSTAEDSPHLSYAGMFKSVLNVDKNNARALHDAVEAVIASYHDAGAQHQVFMQPQIENVSMSGVVFTCDIRTGAPYYVINYDTSGSTHSVTSASPQEVYHLYAYKKSRATHQDSRIKKLLECAGEIEKLTGSETLDVEFAFNARGELFIFQVRPLTITEAIARYYEYDLEPFIASAKTFVEKQLMPKPHIGGETSALGDMPDWNPAEMLGTHPAPLAYSLYAYLIMDSTWREAREKLGYFNPHSEHLMVNICGHPYVDIRNSLNSFTPADISSALRHKLVTHGIRYLKEHPDAHDKLEFEVTATCYTPQFPRFEKRLRNSGFSSHRIAELKHALHRLTCNILAEQHISHETLIDSVRCLDERREWLLKNKSNFEPAELIRMLLDDAIIFGTLPFSILARYAFIGTDFMRSFVSLGILPDEKYNLFFESVNTVAKKMSARMDDVKNRTLPLESFLKEFGHLRPGTYDIQSQSYDENPELYFGNVLRHKNAAADRRAKNIPAEKEIFTKAELKEMRKCLNAHAISVSADALLDFVSRSIEGRELAKFIFTKNISHALKEIIAWGGTRRITREDAAFLDIHAILNGGIFTDYKKLIESAKQEYSLHQQVILPSLIFKPEDVETVTFANDRPNFITSKSVAAPALFLDTFYHGMDLRGKIILIESADPGYDWIFTHGISGLATKYGGAASHMAIRCAEFGLPAAIGCGVKIFNMLKEFGVIELDCEKKTARGVSP